MKRYVLFAMIWFFLFGASVQSFAAQVDISDKVSWDASNQMFAPSSYTHRWNFNTTYSGKNATGAVWLGVNDGTHFCDIYFALDTKYSSPDSRLTRVTMEAFPGHGTSYTQVDYGYLPDSSGDPSLSYDIYDNDQGLGDANGLDWQYAADKPMPYNSVFPGSIYYSKLQSDDIFSFSDGSETGVNAKIQTNNVSFMADGNGGGTFTPVPELPMGALMFLGPMIGFASAWLKRFF